jgi:hypothetical protein
MISFTELGKMGRLGNQLFQIATTIALALRNNDTYVFPPWEYDLHFNLQNCFSNNIRPTATYHEPFFHYQPIPQHNSTVRQTLDLVGFFQSEKYFQDCQGAIQSLLTPKIGFGIKWNYTAIHVRRGDYVRQPQNHPSLDGNYYKKAIDMIPSEYYMIFSDDINWCKQNFIGSKFVFSEGRSPVEDLSLFLSCENAIIANSSFSWWGAWLNKNPSKKIIAPAQWFGPGLPHDTKDLLPNNWIKI